MTPGSVTLLLSSSNLSQSSAVRLGLLTGPTSETPYFSCKLMAVMSRAEAHECVWPQRCTSREDRRQQNDNDWAVCSEARYPPSGFVSLRPPQQRSYTMLSIALSVIPVPLALSVGNFFAFLICCGYRHGLAGGGFCFLGFRFIFRLFYRLSGNCYISLSAYQMADEI